MKLVSLNDSDGTKLGTEREIRLIGKVFCQDNFNKKKMGMSLVLNISSRNQF